MSDVPPLLVFIAGMVFQMTLPLLRSVVGVIALAVHYDRR